MAVEEYEHRITADPDIHHGRPVIQGTRVPVEVVLGSLAGGMDVEAICAEYDIEQADVYAAIAYARDSIAGEEVRSLSV